MLFESYPKFIVPYFKGFMPKEPDFKSAPDDRNQDPHPNNPLPQGERGKRRGGRRLG